ncbi:MAG: DNA polymerase III subunit delta [Candidatus Omnitrophica bacterium]|jgi:DNA polymerase-3 subunit delta|nr:DNA polymerase III subunit delta [Candidatus Omnitrophota bacterium]
MRQAGNIPPNKHAAVYLLTGADEFRKRLCLDKLKRKIMGEAADAFNFNLYYARDISAAIIIDFLQTFSITGSRRMAVLVEPEVFSEEDRGHLMAYIKSCRPENVFLVMLGGKSSVKLQNFSRSLPDCVDKIDTTIDDEDDISDWVIQEFGKNGKKINRATAALISGSARQDMGRALSCIEQVSAYTGARQDITEDDVALFLDAPCESSTFALLDATNAKMPDKALLVLNDLLKTNLSPTQAIGLMAWHIIRLLKVKKMISAGASLQDMMAGLKTGSYRLNKLIAQAKGFSLVKLKKNLQSLSNTDIWIKSSNINDSYLLEALVVKLAG